MEEAEEGEVATGMSLYRKVWAFCKAGDFDGVRAFLEALPIEELDCKYALSSVLGAAGLVRGDLCGYPLLYERVKLRMATVSPEDVQVLEEYYKPWDITD